MKKQNALILSIITALSLCGCDVNKENQISPDSTASNNTESSATESAPESKSESTTSSSSGAFEESEPEELPEQGEPLVLVGLDGNTVPKEDYISALGTDWNEIPTTGLTTKNFNKVEAEGAYVMMPTGCRTVNDHADVFDSKNNVFTDLPPEHKTDFIRVKAGDEICGFKVKSAVSSFISADYALPGELFTDPKTGNKVYFDGSILELEGEIELTGYLRIITGSMTFWSEGDIRFIPADREVNLPVIDYEFDPDEGFYHSVGEVSNYIAPEGETLSCVNEYGAIKLDPAAVDTSGIPAEGRWIKARVKLDNISMSCSTYGLSISAVFADITELTIL